MSTRTIALTRKSSLPARGNPWFPREPPSFTPACVPAWVWALGRRSRPSPAWQIAVVPTCQKALSGSAGLRDGGSRSQRLPPSWHGTSESSVPPSESRVEHPLFPPLPPSDHRRLLDAKAVSLRVAHHGAGLRELPSRIRQRLDNRRAELREGLAHSRVRRSRRRVRGQDLRPRT